jgi:UPF0755 protein
MAERKQKRTRQRRGFLDFVNALLTLIVIALLVCGGLFLYGVHSFYAPGPIKADTDFVVEKGANLSTVAEKLAAQGLIDNPYVFEFGGLASRKHKALKAGEFKLSANASMAQILDELTEGKAVQHGITIPEGFTMAQVVDRLNSDTELTGTLTNIPPEGGILPQTYNFEPGVSRQSVLDQMVAAQQKALNEIWANRAPNLPLASPQQLVTLASIVEKETGVPEERAHVAAVFVNRLNKHMRLQSDPTIIYGVTLGKAPLGRPLKRSEIEAVTPYNTYQVNGLPPTPIDNPGIDSLKAAANPADSNDLYFVAVSTNPSDGHLFAASYTDQQHNVAKLRAAQKLAAADAEAAAAEDQLEAQQAAASGDTSANNTAADTPPSQPAASPASPTTAPAAPPAPAASSPAAPGPAAATSAEPTAPAASPSSPNDTANTPAAGATAEAPPLPMPASARPTSTQSDSTAPAPAQRPAPARPAHPQTLPQDAFGG